MSELKAQRHSENDVSALCLIHQGLLSKPGIANDLTVYRVAVTKCFCGATVWNLALDKVRLGIYYSAFALGDQFMAWMDVIPPPTHPPAQRAFRSRIPVPGVRGRTDRS